MYLLDMNKIKSQLTADSLFNPLSNTISFDYAFLSTLLINEIMKSTMKM